MKILHLSSATTWRGGENQIILLIRGLRELNVKNYLLCAKNSLLEARAKDLNVEIISYTKKGGLSLSTSLFLQKTLQKYPMDIVHVHDAHAHNYAWISALLGSSVPVVVTRRLDFVLKWHSVFKYNHTNVKKVVGVSKAVQKILESGGVRKEKLTQIYSGIDLQIPLNKRGDLKSKLGIEKNKRIVAFVAALAAHKDPLNFVQMCTEILKGNRAEHVHFVMIGADGGMFKQVEKEIDKLSLTDRISITRFIQDMNTVWPDIDVMVMSSSEEGLGTVVLQAFLHGIPVVSTRAGGLPELIVNNETGLLVDIADYEGLAKEVVRILNNQNLRDKLVSNAKTFVDKFDHRKMAQSYLELYNVCLS